MANRAKKTGVVGALVLCAFLAAAASYRASETIAADEQSAAPPAQAESGQASAAQGEAPTVTPCYLAVYKWRGDDDELTLTGGGYVDVRFILEFADLTILELVRDECRVLSFTDDVGTVLLAADQDLPEDPFDGRSEDGKRVGFSFCSTDMPAKTATTVSIEAEMVFLAGEELGEATVENVTLAEGQSFQFGHYVVKFDHATKLDWGGMALRLASSKSFAPIVGFKVFDSTGNEVEVLSDSNSGWVSYGPGQTTYYRSVVLAESLDTATIKVEYYAKTTKVTVPVSSTVGIGL